MAKEPQPAQQQEEPRGAAPKVKKAKPGRKRMGQDVFVPVTMKVEPSELATIEMIARASRRSRSDVMREMLSYGLAHVMESAFAGSPTFGAGPGTSGEAPARGRSTVATTVLDADTLALVDALVGSGRGRRSDVLRRALDEGLTSAGYPAGRGPADD